MIDKELIHQAAEDIDIFQADLTEEFDRLMEARKKPRRRLRLWPLAAAACVAGIIVIFLAPPREANVEPEKQPVVAEQTEKQEETVVKEEPAETKTEVEAPKRTKRVAKRKRVVPQEPIEEPLLTEADAIEEAPTEEVYHEAPKADDPSLLVAIEVQDIRSRGERLGREIAQLTDNKIKYQ